MMISDFLLSCSKQNLLSILSEKQEQFITSKIQKEAVNYFEYTKSGKEYLSGKYRLDQIVKKTLSIKEALYLGYILLFLLDNNKPFNLCIRYVLVYAYK